MNQELIPFEFKGLPVNVALDANGEPWWLAKEVCAVLGITNVGVALARLDDDQKRSIRLADGRWDGGDSFICKADVPPKKVGIVGKPLRAIINQSGLYELIIRSNKPEAKPFRRWITGEVLPAINKAGAYIAPWAKMDATLPAPAKTADASEELCDIFAFVSNPQGWKPFFKPRNDEGRPARKDDIDVPQVFPFEFEGNQVRVVKDAKGDPWWVAKDLCDVLGHTNSSMALQRLDDDEKGIKKVYTPGGLQQMQVVNEPGMWELIIRSNKPQAKPFRRFISHEVLPAIIKTGSYARPSAKKGTAQAARVAQAWAALGRNKALDPMARVKAQVRALETLTGENHSDLIPDEPYTPPRTRKAKDDSEMASEHSRPSLLSRLDKEGRDLFLGLLKSMTDGGPVVKAKREGTLLEVLSLVKEVLSGDLISEEVRRVHTAIQAEIEAQLIERRAM